MENESAPGLRRITIDGKTGAVNSDGEIVIPARFDKVWTQSEGTPVLVAADRKKGYVDLQGKLVIDLKYDYMDAMPFSSCGLAEVAVNGKWGFIDQTGNFAVTPQFDRVYSFRNGYASVILDRKWGYIDSRGAPVIPLRFTGGSSFGKDGLAIVLMEKKYGYINTSGRL